MRKRILSPLLLILFLFSTGASIIDKETKTEIFKLNAKFDQVSQQERDLHQELKKLLKEQKEAIQNLVQKLNSLASKGPPPQIDQLKLLREQKGLLERLGEQINAVEQKMVMPVQAPPVAAPIAPEPAPALQPVPVAPPTPPPPPAPEIKPEFKETNEPDLMEFYQGTIDDLQKNLEGQIEKTNSNYLLVLFVSGFSVLLMIFLLVRMKRGEDRFRRMMVKTGREFLYDDLASKRPQLKVQSQSDRIILMNVGEMAADEIRVLLGSSPSTMRQRLKTIIRMDVGERAEVDIKFPVSDDLLYASLEYKHPESGRIYKEQVTLRLDRLTGQLLPIQQAS